MSGNGNQVPLAPSQRGPGPYPRAPTPHRAECYHPSGAAGATYMPTTAGGAQSTAQAALRVQSTPQSPAQSAPQQDISKTNMAGHTFVPPQNQTPQARQQYSFPYRAQHGTRPSTHPRQQQPFIAPGAAATATGPVMYPLYVPAHMVPQSYQQPRSQGSSLIRSFTNPAPDEHRLAAAQSPLVDNVRTTRRWREYASRSTICGEFILPHVKNSRAAREPPTFGGLQTSGQQTVIECSTRCLHADSLRTRRSGDNMELSSERICMESPYDKSQPLWERRCWSDVGYYQYMPSYLSYSTPATHSSPYYFTSNSQQMQTPNLTANAPGGRSNPTTLMGPQGTQATPTAPTATLTHPQPQTHIHQNMPGIRPAHKKGSRRVPIIDPVTQQDILSDLYPNDSQYLSGDSSERQTPQPEVSHSTPEEFTRMVNEAINQPATCESAVNSNYASSKNVDLPISSTSIVQTQPSAISSINNNVVKSEIVTVNENKNLGPDVVAEPSETPVVSAISDSPVIVPKMPMNIKLQKNSDQNVQSVVLDTNKNIPPNKQHKQNKSKPVVPQVEELVKTEDNVSPVATTAAPVFSQAISVAPSLQASTPVAIPAPQPQRLREPRDRVKSEDKDKKEKDKDVQQEKENTPPSSTKSNGPSPVVISSLDNSVEVINPSTSHNIQTTSAEQKRQSFTKQSSPAAENKTSNISEIKSEITIKSDNTSILQSVPTATELLSASIEKLAKESSPPETVKEASSAIQAQAKLTQSLASCIRTNQPDHKMKDINLNTKNTDSDTANGNTADVSKTETAKDVNKNEKSVKNTKNSNKKASKMASSDPNVKEVESYENGKDETDKVSSVEDDKNPKNDVHLKAAPEKSEERPVPSAYVSKYKYGEDQWSPMNTSGKKCYDIGLLKQIKEEPHCRTKPNVPLLDACNIYRTSLMADPLPLNLISRPSVSIAPHFMQSLVIGARNNTPRDSKKDGRNMNQGGKGSVKLMQTASGSSSHKPVIHVSLSLREDVKLNEIENAWKPSRYKRDAVGEEEFKTQELYNKFRGILNKLTPQKFDTLMDKVKSLEINNQRRLEGVIDLVFEKAIDEPNFSEAYANMCNKLSMLKVPVDNATNPEHCVNFRALIINKCQNQFEAARVDEAVLKLEKEFEECVDSAKKKELQVQLAEENRRVRMRSVGNVRFIGELYKRKMLTSKIMVYCMNYLIEKLEEEKLECLCKLLTTIGQQVESEVREQLDNVFKKMQDIVDRKSNKISSRVRFMIQDVIELRRRRWVIKSVVDSQPKMMDQIQKEAEQHQRQIELMNASPMGGFRRDDGGRKRGEGRRQNSNSFMDNNNWKASKTPNYIDTNKLKQVTQKNLTNIKLAPQNSGWNHGSGTKNTAQVASNSMVGLTKNMYSVLENVQTDPTSLRGNKDITPTYHSKGASIERSTFNSRGDFITSGGGSRSGSVGVTRSNSGSRSTSAAPSTAPGAETPAAPPAPVVQEPLPEAKKKSVKSMIDLCLINPDDDEMVAEVKHLFPPQYHAAVVNEILNVAIEKPSKEVIMIAKSMLHLVSTNTIVADNFVEGLNEIFDVAPDLYIDIPMLYDYLGKFIAPQIEKKYVTLVQILKLSKNIISSNHGHLLLKAVIRDLKESMGPSFVKSKWQESGLQITQWMKEDQVAKWIEDNKFEFLEGGAKSCEETKKILTPVETQSKLLQLMNSDENCECIIGWVQDNLGKASNEDWFMRALIQAICEDALFGAEGRDVPHFNQERMNKYSGLINEFGETRQAREASCLFGIQQLIHRLEHPQGLTLEIFQHLHEQYIISVEGFIAWEESEMEPEGKGVMMKALTSFFINIKEADNEDSCSED